MRAVVSSLARLATIWRTTTFRLTAALVALFALTAIGIVGVIYWQTNALLTRELAREVAREAERLSAFAQRRSMVELVAQVDRLAKQDPRRLYLLQPAGLDDARAGNIVHWPSAVPTDQSITVFRLSDEAGGRRLAIGVGAILADGSRLLVARDATVLSQLAAQVVWWFMAGTLVLALIGLGVGVLISRMVLGRLARISATGEEIMAGRLSERIALEGTGDEFDDLARNLNRMLSRIEELMRSFREVSDNIAHDLKSPLNRLRNRAEEALANPGSERAGLERILAEADDLIRTFNALLQVARLEAGASDESREPLNLSALAQEVVEFYDPVAEEQGASIRFSGEDDVVIEANRQLIGQALINLIENALKYGRPVGARGVAATTGGEVFVSVARNAGEVHLAVADRGGGIRACERETALKRFGRLDRSRSLPGTGLGLSLVGAVARLHGGRIELGDNAPGLIATIVLPDGGKARPGV
jgi:signal transduction histidine kinase